MQELWDALPSLRQILSFNGGLEAVKRATWEILYDTLFGMLSSSLDIHELNLML